MGSVGLVRSARALMDCPPRVPAPTPAEGGTTWPEFCRPCPLRQGSVMDCPPCVPAPAPTEGGPTHSPTAAASWWPGPPLQGDHGTIAEYPDQSHRICLSWPGCHSMVAQMVVPLFGSSIDLHFFFFYYYRLHFSCRVHSSCPQKQKE